MKHTKWLGAGLCAALVACTPPPSDTRSGTSTESVEAARPASTDAASDDSPLIATDAMPPASPPVAIAPAPTPVAPATPAAPATTAVERKPVASQAEPAGAAADTSAVAVLEPAMPAKHAPAKPTPIESAPSPDKLATPVADTPTATNSSAVHLLAGRLELVGSARQAVAAGEAADGVVYFLPESGATRPKPSSVSVDTHSKGFLPGSLVVPAGSTVAFPNRDEILHNVHSVTPGATFDLGTYGPGESRSTRFTKPGLVLVACNVHLGMRANVLVLETPYYTRPGRDGRFELKNLPPGPGTLVFWHPRTVAQSRAITMPATAVAVSLSAVRPRIGAN